MPDTLISFELNVDESVDDVDEHRRVVGHATLF